VPARDDRHGDFLQSRAADCRRADHRPRRHEDLAADADLLIQDAQYTPAEYPQRLGWGHSTYIDALHLAQQARVKQLALYHHDPAHSDAKIDQVMAHCRSWLHKKQATFTCFAASEGQSIML
jgi:ribonuclease BN (tRNA processing enzyme)